MRHWFTIKVEAGEGEIPALPSGFNVIPYWFASVLWGLAALQICSGAAPKLSEVRVIPDVFRKVGPQGLEDLRVMERHVKGLLPRVSPAVVAVVMEGSTGSGVVVSRDGLVLTAAHVCGAPGRSVRLIFSNGTSVNGKTLGTDHDSDAGMIQITQVGVWPYVTTAEDGDSRPGDWVAAMGHPGGFDRDRSVVLRLGRVLAEERDAMQTDCTISAGDSGGPLFDMRGRLVGIHSRISFQAEDNFHIPIGSFARGWARLLKGETWGEVEALSFTSAGMAVEDVDEGCRVLRVSPNGPGSKAGVKVGDMLKQVNGQPVLGALAFQRTVRERRPGDVLKLSLVREGSPVEVDLTLTLRRRGGG